MLARSDPRGGRSLAILALLLVAAGVVAPALGWLLASLALITVAVVVGLVAIGVGVCGRVDGVLMSGRNTYSLSRLQMVLWTVLGLSSVAAIAVCRLWLAGSAGAALAIDIPDELLQAMGISYFSAAAAPAILSLRGAGSSNGQQLEAARVRFGDDISAQGRLVARPNGARGLLRDLIAGDDLETAGTIDLSKVQQLIITLLLIGVYAVELVQLFDEGSLVGVTAALPGFSEGFVGLLLVSHGGYLAYKAASKPGTEATLAPPPSPDRNAGLF